MPEEPRNRRDIRLNILGVISFVLGLILLDQRDRDARLWGTIFFHLGTVTLAAGLAAWANRWRPTPAPGPNPGPGRRHLPWRVPPPVSVSQPSPLAAD